MKNFQDTVSALLRGSQDDQDVSELAGLIGSAKKTSKQRLAQQEAAAAQKLAAAVEDAKVQGRVKRQELLVDLKQQLAENPEPHLVRCYVHFPNFQVRMARDRQKLEHAFRDELSRDFGGMLYFTKVSDATSPWFGQLMVTIAKNYEPGE